MKLSINKKIVLLMVNQISKHFLGFSQTPAKRLINLYSSSHFPLYAKVSHLVTFARV